MRQRCKKGENKTTCSRCGSDLDRPKQRYCKSCMNTYMKERRVKKLAQASESVSVPEAQIDSTQ